jgi:enoyl-CoA hydratase/carnithine racemase
VIAGPANIATVPLAQCQMKRVRPDIAHKAATLTLDRPERKNSLTFESHDEIASIVRAAARRLLPAEAGRRNEEGN